VVTFSRFVENFAVGKTNSITGSGPSAAKVGVLQLRDLDGSVLGTYSYVNGGYGRGYIPSGEYMIQTPQPVRPDQFKAMSIDNIAYKFPVANSSGSTEIPDSRVQNIPTGDNPRGGPRDGIMIHPDGGSRGTMGCIGIQGGGDVQKDFYKKLNYLISNNGGSYPLRFDTGEISVGPDGQSMEQQNKQPEQPPQQPAAVIQQASLSDANAPKAKAFTPQEDGAAQLPAAPAEQPEEVPVQQNEPQPVAVQPVKAYKHKTTQEFIDKLNQIK
jgi:hypothetical protein